jgi:hypothetical protein
MHNKDKDNHQEQGCCKTPAQGSKNSCFSYVGSKEFQNLAACIATCNACAKMCIEEGHKETAIICAECAEVCDLAFKFKSSDSEFSHKIAELCSQVCKKCAEACSKMTTKHCQECAEICKSCSESCCKAHSHC